MNYTEGNLEGCRDMLLHPSMVPGLADTGAHVGSMQDAMNATYLLTYVSAPTRSACTALLINMAVAATLTADRRCAQWVRDRERLTGRPGIPLEKAVQIHTWNAAEVCGFVDRGQIRVGMKADVNVIDLENLAIHEPVVESFVDSFEKMVESDAKRWVQEVSGYELTIISGIVTHEGGVPSGALPGRLVRNPRTAAVREAGRVTEVDLEEVLAGRGAAARPLIGRGSLDKDGWEGDGPPSSAVLEAREDIVVEMKEM